MQPLTIPTDNLYKFLAIFGLVILVSAVVGTVATNTSTNEKVLAYVDQLETMNADIESETKQSTVYYQPIHDRLLELTVKNLERQTEGINKQSQSDA